jgi:hypothetical protein
MTAAALSSVAPARRLVLGRVPADFDPGRDLALGPWCFVGAEAAHPGWEDLPFEDALGSAEDYAADGARTQRLADFLAARWGERLNRRHGVDLPPRYWRTLLVLWLVSAIQAAWQRWRQVAALARRFGAEPLAVAVADAPERWRFRDFAAFWHDGILNPDFDSWLASRIVRRLAPAAWTLVPIAVTQGPPAPPADEAGDGWRRLFGGRPRFDGVIGARWSKVPFSLLLALLPAKEGRTPAAEATGDPADGFPPAFLDLLDDVLARTVPDSYGNDFAARRAAARRLPYRHGKLAVDNLAAVDDRRRFVLAEAEAAGERLVGAQHGGGYGVSRVLPWGPATEYRHHAFLTWGWTRHDGYGGNFVPLPAPMLAPLAGRHRAADGGLVLVGTRMQTTGARYHTCPRPGQWIAYRRAKSAFIAGLETPPRAALRYRPYPPVRGDLADGPHLGRLHPDVPQVEGPLDPVLRRCRLLVLDHPGTTLHLALAAGTPTVCFWNPAHWPLAPSAEPVFEALRRCGVVWHDPAAAAAQVGRVWPDVAGWWEGPEVRAARRAFVDAFARARRLWWWDWARALAAL